MVAFFKRPAAEDGLDARIAVLSRRAQPLANPPDRAPAPMPPATPDNRRATAPEITRAAVSNTSPVSAPDTGHAEAPKPASTAVSPPDLSEEDRFLLAREELLARLTADLSPERIAILSRGELAKVVDALPAGPAVAGFRKVPVSQSRSPFFPLLGIASVSGRAGLRRLGHSDEESHERSPR